MPTLPLSLATYSTPPNSFLQLSSPPPVQQLIRQLKNQTTLDPQSGMVRLDSALMDQIVAQRDLALPGLCDALAHDPNPLALHATLLTLERLKRAGVNGVDHCYGIASRLQDHPHPLVQIALAHLYESLDITCPLGPSVAGLIRASQPATPYPYRTWDPTEAWGHAVGSQLARQAARQTVNALLPMLEANHIAIPQETRQWLAGDQYASHTTTYQSDQGLVTA